MAWWSLYKWFGSFRTTPYENMISWYTNKLNHEWYESLSDEEKEAIERAKTLDEEIADIMEEE